jgi:hypothetical protein
LLQLAQGAQIIQGPNGKKFIILQQKPNNTGGIRLVNPQQPQLGGIRLPTQAGQQQLKAPLIIRGGIPGLAQSLPNGLSATVPPTSNIPIVSTSGIQIQMPTSMASILAGRTIQNNPNP